MKIKTALFILTLFLLIGCKQKPETDPYTSLYSKTTVAANKVYREVNGHKLTLDVYRPSTRLGEPPWVSYPDKKNKTLLYIHGGGWRDGSKDSNIFEILPFIADGWTVVSINYRVIYQTSLPEIIGDCKSALYWVFQNADEYGFDTNQLFVYGGSAGGHLALMTGMAPVNSIYKTDIPEDYQMKVAGIIDWLGITDVELFTKNWKDQHLLTYDSIPMDTIYKYTSVLPYVNKQTPPVLMIYGTEDKVVPIVHGKLLKDKLDQFKIQNQLIDVKGKKHGNFDAIETHKIYNQMFEFTESILME